MNSYPFDTTTDFTSKEKILLGYCCIFTILLSLNPVIYSFSGGVLTLLFALISALNPFSALFYICSSGFTIPQAAGLPFMPAALIPFIGIVRLMDPESPKSFHGCQYLLALLPLLLLSFLKYFHFPWGYVDLMLVAAITCCVLNQTKGQYFKVALVIALSMFSGPLGPWLNLFGFPVTLVQHFRDGMIRWGGVRIDSVSMWFCCFLVFAGSCGVSMVKMAKTNNPQWVKTALITIAAITFPLVMTFTNTSYFGFAVLLAIFIYHVVVWFPQLRIKLFFDGGITIIAIWCCLHFNFFNMQVYYREWINSYITRLEDSGHQLGTRDVIFQHSIQRIAEYPWFGVPAGITDSPPADWETMGYDYYLSHNVFLDIGRGLGIPGMLAYALFVFMPVFIVRRRSSHELWFPYLLMFFAALLFLNLLSFGGNKAYWCIWMAMTMSAAALPEKNAETFHAKRLQIEKL